MFSRDDAATVLQDRVFIEQMKADILRRVEEASDSEEEDDDDYLGGGDGGAKKAKGLDVAFEEELDEEGAVRVRDGGASDDDEGASSEDEDEGGDGNGPGTSQVCGLSRARCFASVETDTVLNRMGL